jgi:hypothetical protein
MSVKETREAWKVTRTRSVLGERAHDGNRFIEGVVWTPRGLVSVDAGRYADGDRYLSLRFIERGVCHSLYTEKFGVFSKYALTTRAARFAKECARNAV